MRTFDINRYCTLNRRRLLQGLGAGLALTVGDTALRRVWAKPVFRHYPFSLAAASWSRRALAA
jgi:hypothetical protein